MSISFMQWKKKIEKHGRKGILRVIYVYGSETVLREEVIDDVWELVSPDPWNQIRVSLSESTESTIWSIANLYSISNEGSRLVQIRDAEQFRNWESLDLWFQNKKWSNTVLLFVSSDDHISQSCNEYLTSHREQTVIINCTMSNPVDLNSWIQAKVPGLDTGTARYLVDRTGGNLTAIQNVCNKLSLFPGNPGPGVIDELCDQGPADTFVESLLSLDRRSAALSAPQVPAQEFRKVVGLLESRLDLLARLRAGMEFREMRAVPGVPLERMRQYEKLSRSYDRASIIKRRTVLAVADDAISKNITLGVMEALCSLW